MKLKEYRYTGKERDDSTGFYYHGARYYAPWMGRWLSADPSGPVDGPNLYVYVSGNPVRKLDTEGTEENELNSDKIGASADNVSLAEDRGSSDETLLEVLDKSLAITNETDINWEEEAKLIRKDMEGGRLSPEVPEGGNSGVTYGYGIDLKIHTKKNEKGQIVPDQEGAKIWLKTAGVSESKAAIIATAAGLTGQDAINWAASHQNIKFTKEEREKTFQKKWREIRSMARARTNQGPNALGKDAWKKVDDSIMAFLTLLTYNSAHYHKDRKNAINAVLANQDLTDYEKLEGIKTVIKGFKESGWNKKTHKFDKGLINKKGKEKLIKIIVQMQGPAWVNQERGNK